MGEFLGSKLCRRSSLAGDKYLAKYLANIKQITKIFGEEPWYLVDYHDICPRPACPLNRDMGLLHRSSSVASSLSLFPHTHKTGNTQTEIYGHLVTSPFAVPFGL